MLDVQGKAIEGALHGLGFGDVAGVRVGKTIEFDFLAGDPTAPRPRPSVKAMCDRLCWPIPSSRAIAYKVEVA